MSESTSTPPVPPAQDGTVATSAAKDETAPIAEVAIPAGGAVEISTLHTRAKAAIQELRFVSERPNSLREVIAYAQVGEWIHQDDIRRRHLATIHARIVALPILSAVYLIAWLVPRPGRFYTAIAAASIVTTALNAIAVINWFIPDWLTLTYWPPFSWVF